MGYLIDILVGIASRIVTGELAAHAEPSARWVIEKAANRLPADDRARFREEWLAHLDETPGTVRKLWHALGCNLAAGKVADVLTKQSETAWRDFGRLFWWMRQHPMDKATIEILKELKATPGMPQVNEEIVEALKKLKAIIEAPEGRPLKRFGRRLS